MSTQTTVSSPAEPRDAQTEDDSDKRGTESASARDEDRNAENTSTAKARRGGPLSQRSLSVTSVATGGVIAALVAGLGFFGWQAQSRGTELDQIRSAASAEDRAESTALSYATGAAEMDYRDLKSWRTRLTKGTSADVSKRLNEAAVSMEQIVAPLQWTSTAEPISAKVTKVDDGAYLVDCFVGVVTKNSQAPDGIQSTATYRLKIDSNQDWKIVDISGVGANVGGPTLPGK